MGSYTSTSNHQRMIYIKKDTLIKIKHLKESNKKDIGILTLCKLKNERNIPQSTSKNVQIESDNI